MTPFPQSGKIKVTPEQSVKVQNRLRQLGLKCRSSTGFRENNCEVCIYWRGDVFDIRGDSFRGQFTGDSRTKYTMTLFESEGEVKICQNCKRYWVAPFPEKCICISTSLAPTHPSNKDLAENFKESEGEDDVWEEMLAMTLPLSLEAVQRKESDPQQYLINYLKSKYKLQRL